MKIWVNKTTQCNIFLNTLEEIVTSGKVTCSEINCDDVEGLECENCVFRFKDFRAEVVLNVDLSQEVK